jgi:DUF971 family protein
MNPHPIKLVLPDGLRLIIYWSDGQRRRYALSELRDACPCATCREKRAKPKNPLALNVLSPAEAQPLAILGMKPVGRYAYSIEFSDGHDTGIYTLELLRQLGEKIEG